LRRGPLPILFTLGFLGYTCYLYASILIISLKTTVGFTEEEIFQEFIYTVTILVDIWTAFFLANLAYGVLKRIGGYFGISRLFGCIPFPDCTSYSIQINAILSQCNATFRLDTRAQIAGR